MIDFQTEEGVRLSLGSVCCRHFEWVSIDVWPSVDARGSAPLTPTRAQSGRCRGASRPRACLWNVWHSYFWQINHFFVQFFRFWDSFFFSEPMFGFSCALPIALRDCIWVFDSIIMFETNSLQYLWFDVLFVCFLVIDSIVKVRETRLTGIVSHMLIGLSVFLLPYPLAYIPTAVLNGLFLYMAITSLNGNQMFERITLLFMEQVSAYNNHWHH